MSRLRSNFGEIHKPVMTDPSISPTSKALYALLATYADQSGFCYPGRARLARELGVSVATVRRCLSELVEAGVLRRIDRLGPDGRQTSSMTALVEESRGVTSDPHPRVTSDPLTEPPTSRTRVRVRPGERAT